MSPKLLTFLLPLLLAVLQSLLCQSNFKIGTGMADMTGLISEGLMFGYAKGDQDARGLHTRLYSRAFVISNQLNTTERFALVVIDTATSSDALRLTVLEKLREIYPNDLYTYDNLMIHAQHTHSAPAGYHTYWIFQTAAGGGYVNETFHAYVNGIVESIRLANDNMVDGDIYFNEGDLLDANINRSPAAYYNNPEEEVSNYEYDVDKRMSLFKFMANSVTHNNNNNRALGAISFFPVHTTSMFNFNHLVSGDNKGIASLLMESDLNGNSQLQPGNRNIVAAFAQGAQGDTSPNVNGFVCVDTGEPCDYWSSACGPDEDVRLCQGQGPAGTDMYANTFLIGKKQYEKASQLYESAAGLEKVDKQFGYIHQFVNFSHVPITYNGEEKHSCRPAMGYSFAAGAADGPGIGPPFKQGLNESDPFIDAIRDTILPPSDELLECHLPKPILIASGEADQEDWPWHPEILPLQIFRLGRFILVGLPVEVTTMAGRRLERRLEDVMSTNGITNPRAIILPLTNSYIHYVVTPEEYEIQRYEGASTVFGKYTLNVYLDKLSMLTEALLNNQNVDGGQQPKDLRTYVEESLDPIRYDKPVDGYTIYGSVINDTLEIYTVNQTVNVTFVSSNPRNNLMTDSTFLSVEIEEDVVVDDNDNVKKKVWKRILTDRNYQTKFYWQSNCEADEGDNPECEEWVSSRAHISWDIDENVKVGRNYRIWHYGNARSENGQVVGYSGVSSVFRVE